MNQPAGTTLSVKNGLCSQTQQITTLAVIIFAGAPPCVSYAQDSPGGDYWDIAGKSHAHFSALLSIAT